MNKFADAILKNLYNHYILWSFLIVVLYSLFDAAYYALSGTGLFYTDTDCYTRALRIIDWLQDFQWAEKIFPYSNVPDGFVLHFTRIADIIWVTLSLPFMAFEPLRNAIFHGGMLFSPLFFFLTLISVFWGLHPYTSDIAKKQKIFAVVFFITIVFCAKLVNIFDFSRPDHHSVMFFILCYNIAVILRAAIYPKESHWFGAGFLAGFGLWISSAVEGLLIVGIVLAILCIQWIFGTFKSRCLMLFSLGLFSSTALSWLVNPPYGGYGVLDTGRLSIVHVVLTALIFISFAFVNYIDPQSKLSKISISAFCTLISILLMFLIFGGLLILSPVYNETIKEIYLPYIEEMRPTFPLYWRFYIISWLSGLLTAGYFLCYGKSKSSVSLTLVPLLLLAFPLGMSVYRFYQYYLAAFIFGSGLLIFKLSSTRQHNQKSQAVLFLYIIFNLFALAGFRAEPQNHKFPEISGNVATDMFDSPKFSFEHSVKTIASPYHTDIEGLTDNYILFFSEDENEIKHILKKHQIDYIYLPKETTEYYQNPEDNTDKLYGKIITGKNLYPWLEYIPTNIKKGALYKIRYDIF